MQQNRSDASLYTLLRQGDEVYGLGGGVIAVLRGDSWQRFDPGLTKSPFLSAGAVLDARSLLVAGGAGALHVVTTAGRTALAAGTGAQR